MQQDGKFKVTGLTPIYGFRSPRFNRQTIEGTPDKNLKVWWSMHQYGRAMDFIIDEDNDLVMDGWTDLSRLTAEVAAAEEAVRVEQEHAAHGEAAQPVEPRHVRDPTHPPGMLAK